MQTIAQIIRTPGSVRRRAVLAGTLAALGLGAAIPLALVGAAGAQTTGSTPPGTIVLRASGTALNGVWPRAEVRVNGSRVSTITVNSATAAEYRVTASVPAGAKVDVAFVNDAYTRGLGDRNLFVESVTLNGQTVLPAAGNSTFDRGAGAKAYDGIDVLPGRTALYWNGALRLTAPGTVAAPLPKPTPVTQPPVPVFTTVPATATSPWPILQFVNALSFTSRSAQLTTVWGSYWERSETSFNVDWDQQTQEIGNAANGNHAVYAVDMGSGVDTITLRVSLPSGVNGAEFRLGSVTGPLLGSCTINSTGGDAQYKTIGCPVDPLLAKGKQSLVVLFTGPNATMRLNWLAFWASNTTQAIDGLMKVQRTTAFNKPAPTVPLAGTPVRSQASLPAANEVLAQTYGAWSPSKPGECPKWLHDSHWVRGDDGKIYPTWHPPVDFNPETGTYCTYAHEHGDDPRGSEAFAIGGMPAFGIVNEAHSPNDLSLRRREDHYGHKIRVGNNWQMYNRTLHSDVRSCDILVKLHMGTHSPDALTNTAHELITYGQCEGLEPFNIRHFALFGTPGTFKEAEAPGCGQGIVSGITPSPPNQPNGGAFRSLPTRDCYQRGTAEEKLAHASGRTNEFWLTGMVGGNLYAVVQDPSRLFDPATPNKIGRTVDACYDPAHPLATTLQCQLTVASSAGKVAWDDPRSLFRGAFQGNTHISAIAFGNSPAAVTYTNAYGQNSRTQPDPANGITVKQLVPTTGFDYRVDSHFSVFPTADYSAAGRNGVRAPN